MGHNRTRCVRARSCRCQPLLMGAAARLHAPIGCRTSPVGYLEGIYVDETHRRKGAARALVLAGEAWARRLGCTEFASDRALDNDESGAFHRAAGFDEVERIVCYRKDL